MSQSTFRRQTIGGITVLGEYAPTGELHGRLLLVVPGHFVQTCMAENNKLHSFVRYQVDKPAPVKGTYTCDQDFLL